ncbi:MAG: hypothetical protein GY733_13750 [bacterium]|nr:hypothetical protein [bacterium]
MSRIPRIAHFVFGLRSQNEPFHLLHYLAIESCRRILRPKKIVLHHHFLPYGAYWDAIRPHLELQRVELAREVSDAHYDEQLVPEVFRYAHHADFVRLDALIEQGGVYADIDTLFLRPLPDALYDEPFVIGRESTVLDERSGESKPSLCNALLMAEPGALFARKWRKRMGGALNGTWSNHSGFLAQTLSEEFSEHVHVEPEQSFFAFPCSREGLAALFGDPDAESVDTQHSYSVHLWEHLWRDFQRTDFSNHYGGEVTPAFLRAANTPLGQFAAPFLPELDIDDVQP